MMRFAFCSFSAPQASLADLLKLAHHHGHDGIEPRIESRHRRGVELATAGVQRDAIRRAAEASGQVLVSVDTSCRLAHPATADQEVEKAITAIDLAADVGPPSVRGSGGQLAEGVNRQDAHLAFVTALRPLSEDAYDGYLSGGWIGWEPAETRIPRELATLHCYRAELP